MSKKKTVFRFDRDEEPAEGQVSSVVEGGPPPRRTKAERSALVVQASDENGRPLNVEHRAQMEDLKDLANRLAKLPRGQRHKLPLSEETQAQIDMLEAADGRVDRRRVLMRAKLLVGREDLVRLEAALLGDTDAAALDRELVAWRTRIVAGDDADIQAFMEIWPHGDRQAIRSTVREARGEGPGAAAANRSLLRLLRSATSAASSD